MARYVDGFVMPLPKKNLAAYKRMASSASKVWRDHGALAYSECIGDDLKPAFGLSFEKMAKAKRGETVVFAFIVYKSKSHRDKVNAKVMKDPRLAAMMNEKKMPFDPKKMGYGGFIEIVRA